MSPKPAASADHRRSPNGGAPGTTSIADGRERVALSDRTQFQTFNGLWKGKKGPLTRAIVIRNTNFTNDGTLDLSNAAELDVETKQLASRMLQVGDIIIERSGGGPKQAVGRVCYFDADGPLPYSFSNFTSVIRVLERDRLLPRYVHYYLLHLYKNGYTQGLQHATTGIRNLDFTSYLQAEIPMLEMLEQKKIAAILWKLQRAIATQDRLIAVTSDLKQSAMRRLFTHGLRGEPLKDTEIGLMPESWTVLRLDSCCDVLSSRLSYSDLAGSEDSDDEDAVLVHGVKVSDMNLPGNELQFCATNLSRRMELATAEKRAVPSSTVIFPKRGAAIATNKKRLTTTWTVLDPNLIGVRARPGLDTGYLRQWFDQFDLRSITEPGPTPQLNKKHLTPLLLPIPTTESEQSDIAAALATIDRKLAHHRAKRAALDDLFQTTLHQLMTGQIRVADLDIDTSEVTTAARQGEAA